MEKQILNLVYTNRQAWEKVKDKFVEAEFSPHGWAIMKEVGRFYGNDPDASSCDRDIILARLKRAYPKAGEIFSGILAGFGEISVANVLQELFDFKRSKIREKLATKLLDEKQEDVDSIGQLWEEYNSYLVADDETDNTLVPKTARSVSDVVHNLRDDASCIKLYPECVNKAVGGGVPLQTHIVLFAPPEIGKSAYAINQAVMSARDGHKVLFFDNEDPEDQTWIRIQSRVTGMTREEIYNDGERCQQLLDTCGFYENLAVVSHAPGTLTELEQLIKEVKPKLFICNQIMNLKIRGVDSDVAQLTISSRAMRSIIKRNNIVGISVTQAGDSAARKAVLDMGDVYMSNCLAPGTMVRMFDGTSKAIETIEIGEQVLGMDSTPRTVKHVGRGTAPMYKITHKNGDSYTVNEAHILTVKAAKANHKTVDIPLKKLLDNPGLLRNSYKGFTVPALYSSKEVLIDPWLFGLWLADGFSHTFAISSSDQELVNYVENNYKHLDIRLRTVHQTNTVISLGASSKGYRNRLNEHLRTYGVWKHKHIPQVYKTSSIFQRYALLSGIIDGDGYLYKGLGNHRDSYRIACGWNRQYAEDIKEVALSCGFASSLSEDKNNGYYIYIAGQTYKLFPILERKQSEQRAAIHWECSNLTIEKVADAGDYCGITVDGDERYVLANYIVTHNTTVPATADLMIGIGATSDMVENGYRTISLPKNKITGDHEPRSAQLHKLISRYTSL